MRKVFSDKVERGRINPPMYRSTKPGDHNGVFNICSPTGMHFHVIISDGGGWEHVSLSTRLGKRLPTWEEMCFIKDLFWDAEETVIQIHPAQSEYVNNHPNCLHLWKPTSAKLPVPPTDFVGKK